MITPLMIEMLIHYYCSPTNFRDLDAPAISEAINLFCELDLIYYNTKNPKDSKYLGRQEALEPYINALCSVPLPVEKWVIPDGGIIRS